MIKNFFKNHPIHKKIVIYFDLFNLLAPLNYFLIWSMLSVGMYLGLFILDQSPQFIINHHYKVFFLFFGISTIMSSYYIDQQLVQSNKRSSINFIKEKYSINFIQKFNKYLIISGIVLLFFSSWINFLLGIILFIFNKFLLKNHFNDNFILRLIHQLLVGFIISTSGLIYVLHGHQMFPMMLVYLKLIMPYLFLYIGVFIILNLKEFNDYKTSKLLCLISSLLIIFGILLSIQFNEPLASISLIVSLPFFLYSLIRGLNKDYQRVYTYPLAILNFFCMTIFPYLFVLSFIVFYLTKYYNWHRFNFHFPTFLVEND